MENRFYIGDNSKFSEKQIKMIKLNNRFVLNVLTSIFNNKGPKELSQTVLQTIFARKLIYSDVTTNFNTNRLGEKLAYIVKQCENPVNKDKIFNSYLMGIIYAFTVGNIEGNDGWAEFKHSDNCEPNFKNYNALNIAMTIYNDDYSIPIGLNLSALIDTIVKIDKNDRFNIEDTTTLDDKDEMSSSLIMFLQSIKNTERFKKNLFIPKQDEDNPHNKDSH